MNSLGRYEHFIPAFLKYSINSSILIQEYIKYVRTLVIKMSLSDELCNSATQHVSSKFLTSTRSINYANDRS